MIRVSQIISGSVVCLGGVTWLDPVPIESEESDRNRRVTAKKIKIKLSIDIKKRVASRPHSTFCYELPSVSQ